MKRAVSVAAGLLLSVGLAGCGSDNHEDLVTDMVDTVEQFHASLDEIGDPEEAEAAFDTLDGLADRMQDLEARMEALDDIPPELDRELTDRYRDRLHEAMIGIMTNMSRLEQVGAFEPLEPIFTRIGMSFDEEQPSDMPHGVEGAPHPPHPPAPTEAPELP